MQNANQTTLGAQIAELEQQLFAAYMQRVRRRIAKGLLSSAAETLEKARHIARSPEQNEEVDKVQLELSIPLTRDTLAVLLLERAAQIARTTNFAPADALTLSDALSSLNDAPANSKHADDVRALKDALTVVLSITSGSLPQELIEFVQNHGSPTAAEISKPQNGQVSIELSFPDQASARINQNAQLLWSSDMPVEYHDPLACMSTRDNY